MATAIQMVKAIFDFVVANGQKVGKNKFGGCWGADTWEFNGIRVQLCDDGYTHVVITDNLRANQTYTFDVQYYNGGEAELTELYNTVFNVRVEEERACYLWL